MNHVNLGDEVVCTVSGFKGIVTSITSYLNGCRRAGVQPKVGADGKLPDSYWVDEPQLKVTKAAKVPVGPQKTGGPTITVPAQKAR